MGLKEDVKSIIEQLFGPDAAKEIDVFEDPGKYPKDFLDECMYFLGKLIGHEAAMKKFEPLYRKYVKEH